MNYRIFFFQNLKNYLEVNLINTSSVMLNLCKSSWQARTEEGTEISQNSFITKLVTSAHQRTV